MVSRTIDKKQARKKKIQQKAKNARTRTHEINRLDKYTIVNPYKGLDDNEYLSDHMLYREVMDKDLPDGKGLSVPTELGEMMIDAKGLEFIKQLSAKRGGTQKSQQFIKYWLDIMMA